MAGFDPENDTVPALAYPGAGQKPSVATLRTAIAGSGVAASYPTARLETATKNDLVYICRVHSIAVAGL